MFGSTGGRGGLCAQRARCHFRGLFVPHWGEVGPPARRMRLPRLRGIFRRRGLCHGHARAYSRTHTRIRPRLDFRWPGTQSGRCGFSNAPAAPGGRRAAWLLRCTIPINQRPRRSWCIASIAIAILNIPVFWDEDVLSAVFNRCRIWHGGHNEPKKDSI